MVIGGSMGGDNAYSNFFTVIAIIIRQLPMLGLIDAFPLV
jgi:hypothetical protein